MATSAFLVASVMAILQAGGDVYAPRPDQVVIGEYRRTGAGFVCSVKAANDQEALRKTKNYCLHYGPLAIGLPRREAERLLGKPLDTVQDAKGKGFVYPRAWSDATHDRRLLSYVVVVFDLKGLAKAIQVSGDADSSDWRFSSVRLGDPSSSIVAALGNPFETSLVSKNGAEFWQYSPWKFSFEVKDRTVTSIRLDAES